MNLKKEKATALSAAKQASKILLHYFGKKVNVTVKENKSLVAVADIESNKAVISAIKKSFPDHSILSEETGFKDNNSDYKWVIDPLDGTHNFLHGIPIFATSIALEYKGKPVLGVLHFPVFGITAFAEKGKGALVNGKKISVSRKKNMDHSIIGVEMSFSNREDKIKLLEKFIDRTVDIRNFGSAVYHLFLIASGRSDGYIIMATNEWDVAAGFLLVEEAGGKITTLEGKSWDFVKRSYVVSNGRLHEEILKFIN